MIARLDLGILKHLDVAGNDFTGAFPSALCAIPECTAWGNHFNAPRVSFPPPTGCLRLPPTSPLQPPPTYPPPAPPQDLTCPPSQPPPPSSSPPNRSDLSSAVLASTTTQRRRLQAPPTSATRTISPAAGRP
jgi:hypothetical protein